MRNKPKKQTNKQTKPLSAHITGSNQKIYGGVIDLVTGLYVPANGEYVLSAAQPEDNTQIYLTLNGQPIWNLTQTEYTFTLNKGTTGSYGLMIVKAPEVATGVDQAQTDDLQGSKVIINGTLFILRNGQMYDACGRKVK